MNNKINSYNEPTLESLSKNFASNNKDVLHSIRFKFIVRYQQHDKSLIGIYMEKPKDYSIKQFHAIDKMYSLICRHGKIVIPKQIQKPL